MSENDYIAEYVKENAPYILGFDYHIWRARRGLTDAAKRIADVFSNNLKISINTEDEDTNGGDTNADSD